MPFFSDSTDDKNAEVIEAGNRVFHVEEDDSFDDISDSDEDTLITEETLVKQRKSICFEEKLLQLAKINISSACRVKRCKGIVSMKTKYIGSSVRILWVRLFC